MPSVSRDEFISLFISRVAGQNDRDAGRTLAVPVSVRLLADQLTPVLAYRRLVSGDERTAPSFLLESVEGGRSVGRYSIMGAQPARQVVAHGYDTAQTDLRTGESVTERLDDPVEPLRALSRGVELVLPEGAFDRGLLPRCVLGGWFGYAGYDTVRYAEPGKLGFEGAPPDDRGLADLSFAFYDGVVVFDHVAKTVFVVQLALVTPGDDPAAVYDAAVGRLEDRVAQLGQHSKAQPLGRIDTPRAHGSGDAEPMPSNTTREQHGVMVERAKEYIRAGDIFQVVLGQRFERASRADPFDVYRALRAVNPSPYMVYMQGPGAIVVSASPEILCRVRREGEDEPLIVTNRPLAGTRRRGRTPAEDAALEAELLGDAKERAEHAMLVDLGRNDVGRVCEPGSIELPAVMAIERYSHVMHISSTVTGRLRGGLDCWDALRAALPVGTVSGAPKVRAMQIIDELEPVRRGPYGGGFGWAGLDGQMDIALALRTIVVPTGDSTPGPSANEGFSGRTWVYHIQAGGGIVADSKPEAEYMETVNKAAALGRAVELAESAFMNRALFA